MLGAHIPPGRDDLFKLIRGMPASLRSEPGLILANGDYVIVHGRFSNIGLPKNWIAADIVRIAGGVLVEHWDVLQDEATRAESQSGLAMFGEKLPEWRRITLQGGRPYTRTNARRILSRSAKPVCRAMVSIACQLSSNINRATSRRSFSMAFAGDSPVSAANARVN